MIEGEKGVPLWYYVTEIKDPWPNKSGLQV